MNITNGTVTFERTIRPADFESKKASVTLSFALDADGKDGDGGEAIDRVGDLARHHALNMLGIMESRPEAPPMEQTVPKRTRAPRVDPAAVTIDAAPPTPAAMTGEPAPSTVAAESVNVSDPAAIVMPPAAPVEVKPVSDKDLTAACNAAVARKVDPVVVRLTLGKLAGKAEGVTGSVADIAPDNRADALKTITELKAAA